MGFNASEAPRLLRLVRLPPMSGYSQMALDHALLLCAREDGFLPVLRFQRWEPPAVSLGRFQDISELDLEECARRGIEVVRRPTGGKALLHLDDFTYSVVLPPSYPLPPELMARYRRISGGIIRALGKLGLEVRVGDDPGGAYRAMTACFASGNAADLKVNGRKICGSAQLARKGAVLQHGTLYLEDNSWLFHRLIRHGSREERELALRDYRSACTTLGEVLGRKPSWAKLENAFTQGFEEELELKVVESGLTPRERIIWKTLEKSYRSQDWLQRRKGGEEPELEDISPGRVGLAGDNKVSPTPSALAPPSRLG